MTNLYKTGNLEDKLEDSNKYKMGIWSRIKGHFEGKEEPEQIDMGRRKFMGNAVLGGAALAVGGASLLNLGEVQADTLAEQGYHPLYDILLNNVNRYTPKQDRKNLKLAIIDLARNNSQAAAVALIPGYIPSVSRNVIINVDKVESPGGDNPVYWTALRLASHGVGHDIEYGGLFGKNYNPQRDPKLPSDRIIIAFAKVLSRANNEDDAYQLVTRVPEVAPLFGLNFKDYVAQK